MADKNQTTPEVRDGAFDNEKGYNPKDTDSSSGNVETLEGAIPSADLMVVDKATERAVLRKLDYRIVPTVMWVYLMNMMDRGKSRNNPKPSNSRTD